MDIILNFGFAWITVALAVILSIIFFTRLASKKSVKFKQFFSKINTGLRKHHKNMGIFLVFAGLIHVGGIQIHKIIYASIKSETRIEQNTVLQNKDNTSDNVGTENNHIIKYYVEDQ